MERKLSPGVNGHKRASSNCSIDLPTINVKQEPIDSDEEEKKGGSSVAQLEKLLRESEAKVQQAKLDNDKMRSAMMNWVEKAGNFDNQRHAAEQALKKERLKAKETGDLDAQRAENAKLMEKYEQAAQNSIDNAQRASDAQNAATRLSEELATSKQELQSAREANVKVEELLKQEKLKKSPVHEHTALDWKYKELQQVHDAQKVELNEALRSIGLLRNEKDGLLIDLEIAKANIEKNAPSSEAYPEMAAKIAELESNNDRLRSLMEQISHEKTTAHLAPVITPDDTTQRIVLKNVENQRFIARLQEENADLNDRLEKLASRLERYTCQTPSGSDSRSEGNHHTSQRGNHRGSYRGAPRGGYRGSQHGPYHEQSQYNRFNRPNTANVNDADAKTMIEDLSATVRNQKKIIAELSNMKEMLEKDRDELRATLREKSQMITQLETDIDLYRTRAFTLEATKNDLRAELEKNSKEAKECSKMIEKVEGMSALIDVLEEEKAKVVAQASKEKQEMEEEMEELREKNVALASVSSKELREKLKAAEKEIDDLKKEICKAGPSKAGTDDVTTIGEKGKRIIVQQVAPPPFMLRASAPVAPPPPGKPEKGWTRGFQPLGPFGPPPPKKLNAGPPVDRPVVEHSIFERPHITAEVRDKIKFKLHPC